MERELARRESPLPAARCDGCAHAKRCAATGLVCEAFQEFTGLRRWNPEQRAPSLVVTRRAREYQARTAAAELNEDQLRQRRAILTRCF